MNKPAPRRDCPSLARPMRTGDGLMLRLTPIAPMPAAAWAELADVAEGLGNGLIDLTLRGAVQVRGLRDETVAAAQARLLEAGFVESRPVLATDPLGPDDPRAMGDSHTLAARLADLLTTHPLPPGLPPKVTVALDAAGRLDQLTADLRLRWVGVDQLWLIVGEQVLAECRADAGPALVRDYLERLARAGCRGMELNAAAAPTLPSPRKRGTRGNTPDLYAPGPWPPAFAGEAAIDSATAVRSHPLPLGPKTRGIHLLAPAFGALTSAQLRELLAIPGLTALRPAAGRRLAVWGQQGAGCFPPFLATDDADPRLAVTACPGAPACGSALRPTRGLATALAAGNYGVLHLSGCGKGCGAPGDGTAQAIATADGWDLQGDDVSRLAAGLAAMGERRNDAL
ncbi:hypothetical protein [Niveispirillum sp. BGYR6]|uniref:hypothetical protein n=1 Tax=Niveispirillum sp. BGYR6 TaxID=2971249 RepID=UPI0022B948CF|nr:hypothetical protein [Niveispirillum sp. BGYR6]MDG5493529.1 hypothetical protein [Niveispirillum sp. BGYR6]